MKLSPPWVKRQRPPRLIVPTLIHPLMLRVAHTSLGNLPLRPHTLLADLIWISGRLRHKAPNGKIRSIRPPRKLCLRHPIPLRVKEAMIISVPMLLILILPQLPPHLLRHPPRAPRLRLHPGILPPPLHRPQPIQQVAHPQSPLDLHHPPRHILQYAGPYPTIDCNDILTANRLALADLTIGEVSYPRDANGRRLRDQHASPGCALAREGVVAFAAVAEVCDGREMDP